MIDENDDEFVTIIGHDGKPTRVIRDGGHVRVRMSMMDHALPPSVRAAMRDSTTPLHDGRGNKPGHKPGFVMSDAAQQNELKQQAYDLYDAAATSAWIGNPPTGAGERGGQRGQREGDLCTINGAPGYLRYDDDADEMVCVPDGNRDSRSGLTLDQLRLDHEKTMQLEYDRYSNSLRSAYKGR